MIQMKDESD